MDPVSLVVSLFVAASQAGISRIVSSKQKRAAEAQRRHLAAQSQSQSRTGSQSIESPLAQAADPGGPQIGVFGRRRVGGRVILSARASGSTYIIILIAGAPAPVNAIYINNGLIARDGSNNVTTAPWTGSGATLNIKIYDGTQTAVDSVLDTAFPGWNAQMIGTGQTYARIKITPGTNTAYESGTPDFTFDVSGFAAYDPRNEAHDISDPDTWDVTTNAAIIAGNYLIHDLGRKLPHTSVDWDSVAAAANICDELVLMASGLSEYRYSCAAYWQTNESHEAVIAKIEMAMAGHVYFLGTKYRVEAGTFDDSSAVAITPNDYVGDGIAWADTPPMDQMCNGVRGRFASPTNNYELRDFPAYQDATALADDGGEHWLDLTFEFVTSHTQAQRLARIAYHKARRGYTVSLDTRFAFFDVVRGDIVALDDPLAGIDTTFRVEGEAVDPEFGIEFDLSFEDATFWDWDADTDESPMPAPVSLTSAGGVGVNPDDTGPLQPPGFTAYGYGTLGGLRIVRVAFAATPSGRANRYVVEYPAGSTELSTGAAYLDVMGWPSDPVGTIRVRSKVLETNEVSDWGSRYISKSNSTMQNSPNNAASTTPEYVLPVPKALQIATLGVGAATLNYFDTSFPQTTQLEIWRNTINSPGGTLVGTYSNADGSINETQPAGTTRYYFARFITTSPSRTGAWSNALLVAY